jgi:hypothetical protein
LSARLPSPESGSILPAEEREIRRVRAADPKAFAKFSDADIVKVLRVAAATDARLRLRVYRWSGPKTAMRMANR